MDPEEELERYQYQMYHFIATAFKKLKNLEGIHILDIGSGRGGGLAYIVKRLKPITAVGIDISSKQVDFCNQTYNFPNLKFAQGDAENLPVHDSCVDIVINIESSHCYSNFSAFVSEVARALKPGGHFIITDFVYRSDLENKENILNSNVLQLIDKEEITENVILSLNFDSERKEDMLDKAP